MRSRRSIDPPDRREIVQTLFLRPIKRARPVLIAHSFHAAGNKRPRGVMQSSKVNFTPRRNVPRFPRVQEGVFEIADRQDDFLLSRYFQEETFESLKASTSILLRSKISTFHSQNYYSQRNNNNKN